MNLQRQFVFILLPRFSLLAVSCALDALRAANLACVDRQREQAYNWQLASVDDVSVSSSCGIALPTTPLEQLETANVIALCGGDSSHNYKSSGLNAWLHQRAQSDAWIGSISDGAFVLAASGLLQDHRSTIHWKCQEAYRARFPNLDVRASILEFDRRRFSCAGGTASLDLMLHFIRQDLGSEIIADIASNYIHDTVRDNTQAQDMTAAYRHAKRSRILAEAIALMTANLENSLPISAISARVGTTHRSLDRLFKRHLGVTPGQHFRYLRLARAASLLAQTGLPISEIALNCGFSTASHLGRNFRITYNMTPNQYRQQSQIG